MPAISQDKMTPDDLAWKARIILVKAHEGSPSLKNQIKIIEDNNQAFKERDIIILFMRDKTLSTNNLLNAFPLPSILDENWYEWIKGFIHGNTYKASVLLIGKDGGLKRIWTGNDLPVQSQEIFEVINSMPMRQQEIQNKDE